MRRRLQREREEKVLEEPQPHVNIVVSTSRFLYLAELLSQEYMCTCTGQCWCKFEIACR